MASPDRLTEIKTSWAYVADNPTARSVKADIDWLVGEIERLREEREAIFRRSNAAFESKDQRIKEWRHLAEERGQTLHAVDHVLEQCREEVARLRDGIKAALGCHTETARRVTLQELLDPQNANEAPQP